MNIGSLTLKNNTILAPLAGITNMPFRLMVKECGCGLACSEMVSSNGLVYQSKNTLKYLDSSPEEKPLSVQIFGSKPEIMAEAAIMVEESGADILDINFGCSVKKVLKTGSGSALMKDLKKSEQILKSVRKVIKIPFTIKIRTGWDKSGKQAFLLSKIAQDCGVDALIIHPRTAQQGFTGLSDWSIIKQIKTLLKIPVIGNGDIKEAAHAIKMLNETGCDGIMVGRAATMHPMIFSEIINLLENNEIKTPEITKQFDLMKKYLEYSVNYSGERNACFAMRGKLGKFVKGMPESTTFRQKLTKISSQKEAESLINEYRDFILENH